MLSNGGEGALEVDRAGNVVDRHDLAGPLAVGSVMSIDAGPERVVLGLEPIPQHDALLLDPTSPTNSRPAERITFATRSSVDGCAAHTSATTGISLRVGASRAGRRAGVASRLGPIIARIARERRRRVMRVLTRRIASGSDPRRVGSSALRPAPVAPWPTGDRLDASRLQPVAKHPGRHAVVAVVVGDAVEDRLVTLAQPALELDHAETSIGDRSLAYGQVGLLDLLERIGLDRRANALPYDVEEVDETPRPEQPVEVVGPEAVPPDEPLQRPAFVTAVVEDMELRVRLDPRVEER